MKIVGYVLVDITGVAIPMGVFMPASKAWTWGWKRWGGSMSRRTWIAARKADGWRCHPVGEAVP